MSEGWSTAWVGWSLSHRVADGSVRSALVKAASALRRCQRPDGWGYNRTTGPDADSTAWVIRFLSLSGCHHGLETIRLLESYIDVCGRAHTFREATAGSWGDAHPDVTPIVGLALLTSNAPIPTIERIRNAVLDGRSANGVWRSFWWATDAYATAWSVEFLAKTGGIPEQVTSDVTAWLRHANSSTAAFMLSYQLLTAVTLGLSQDKLAATLVDNLLDLAVNDHGWPPSSQLLVPPKTGRTETAVASFSDTGLMTTAIAASAIARWLNAVG